MMQNRCATKAALMAFGITLAVSAATAARADTTWRMASAYPESNFHTQNLQLFIKEVEEATDGKLKIQLSMNSSLYKAPDILQAVETGQVQAGEILLSTFVNEKPLYAADSIAYLISGYDQAWKLYQATKPLLEESFDERGVEMLYTVAWPGGGFYSAVPIEKKEDLQGRKMRSAAPITAKWTDRLGMTMAVIQLPELAQAFSTGMVDMMFTSSPMAPSIQAWEFTKYFYDLQAIHAKNAIIVNKAALEALEPDVREKVLAAAAAAEVRGWEMSKEADDGYKKQMSDGGMIVTPISPEVEEVLKAEAKVVNDEWIASLPQEEQDAIRAGTAE